MKFDSSSENIFPEFTIYWYGSMQEKQVTNKSKIDENKKNLLSADEIVGGQWKTTKKIDSGTHGEIYRALDINTNETVAVKVESTGQNHAVCTNTIKSLKESQSIKK